MNKTFPALESIHTVAFDFDGVFTNNKVWLNQDGLESVCCDRGDGLAFDMVRNFQRRGLLSAEFFIISKETNSVILARSKKLKINCYHNIQDKLTFMKDNFAQRLPDLANPFVGLVYLGNDLNDLPIMRCAGYAVAPADAHPLVRNIAHLVMEQRGGDGFVRAFIEKLLRIEEFTEEEFDELVSDR